MRSWIMPAPNGTICYVVNVVRRSKKEGEESFKSIESINMQLTYGVPQGAVILN